MDKKKYIVAVSGGVDSVVLLHMLIHHQLLWQRDNDEEPAIIVAHFDHGIREDSAADADFVRQLAELYAVPFETRREGLGSGASEDYARNRRYAFLRELATVNNATIVTAHHADDVVETVAINLMRGTGWRGLAVLDSNDVIRPLLNTTKAELIQYAKQNELTWREDSTNLDTKYLRNHVRKKLEALDEETKKEIRLYYKRQLALKRMIDQEIDSLACSPYSRYFYICVPYEAGIELIRGVLLKETGVGATRPQLEKILFAIKSYRNGAIFEINNAYEIRFSVSEFIVVNRQEMIS